MMEREYEILCKLAKESLKSEYFEKTFSDLKIDNEEYHEYINIIEDLKNDLSLALHEKFYKLRWEYKHVEREIGALTASLILLLKWINRQKEINPEKEEE